VTGGVDVHGTHLAPRPDTPVAIGFRPDDAPPSSRWARFTASRVGGVVATRLPLVAVLLLQTVLAFRVTDSAFEDEALYVFAGHREIALLLHGTPTYDSYPSYFSGAPFLYPVAAAAFDGLWGLEGARALSLLLMLGATVLLWMSTRRMYGQAAAVVAATLFATSAPTLFLSRLATYDAPAVFLLALALWIVVRTARAPVAAVLAAAPVLALAAAVKYASLLFVPTVIVVAALAVPMLHGGTGRRMWTRGAVRAAMLTVAVVGLIALFLAGVSPDLRNGIAQTTTHRTPGNDPFSAILQTSLVWGGWIFVLALVGVVVEARRPTRRGSRAGTRTRVALASVLAGTALLAPLDQWHLHTLISLHKHVGFGLLFAAPAAGAAVTRLARLDATDTRRRLRGLVVGICLMLAFYAGHAVGPMYGWPNSAGLIATLRPVVREGHQQRYMSEENEIPRYYLKDSTEPYEWLTTYYFQYTLKNGQTVSGAPAFKAAIADRYYTLVILDYGPTAALDRQIDGSLNAKNSGYRLLAKVPGQTSHGIQYYYIWALR
jgi:4-amino-4-deoxy-L-arabinose transferase-like glycosyltransferase